MYEVIEQTSQGANDGKYQFFYSAACYGVETFAATWRAEDLKPSPPTKHFNVKMEPLAASYITQVQLAYHHFLSERVVSVFHLLFN